jgi:hypothetical protein
MTEAPRPRRKPARRPNAQWRRTFLDALAETSNVRAAARAARIPVGRAYKTRRGEPEFRTQWYDALLEGYEHLEMETLHRLRMGTSKDDPKFDIAAALRLLALHRETVARERAFKDDEDEQAVLDSIDAFIEDMRQRRAANAAILLAPDEDGPEDDGAL